MRWLSRWWPALIWAAVISAFSTHFFTAENTGHILIPILHRLFPGASQDSLELMHHYIRKCAHFTNYFILSLLILRSLREGQHATKLGWALLAIALVFCYASLDEFHQSFVPGRTPLFTDVLIDTSGAIVAQIVAALLLVRTQARDRQNRTAQLTN